jgi:hypothetical protein
MQRLDRNYAEILQEIRVAQTGVQLLLAFLLSLAFTPRFSMLSPFDRSLYVATLLLGSASAALLMAPACYHRVVFRRRLKRHLVQAANRFAATGLALLGLALACAVLLILKIVVSQRLAAVLTSGVLLWFGLWWYALPMWTSLRHRRRTHTQPTRQANVGRPVLADTTVADAIVGDPVDIDRVPPNLAPTGGYAQQVTPLHQHRRCHRGCLRATRRPA